ncbi:hypothetical protein PI125_g19536 [Phytophthora idaei]|nr:hypothetical protein PI125_g19536 [Phytophthora idaei]KAG3135903.1 hypothetical protein PI126_g18047 [Phytophthora idaei]
MAWRVCVLVVTVITLVNIAATPSLAASVALEDKNVDTSGRFLRVVNTDEERTVASAETIASLVKSKSGVSALAESLPSKLVEIEKKFPIVVPGVSVAVIKARLKLFYWHSAPPVKVFRYLGLGRYSEARREKHPFYKYYKDYNDKWAKAQEHLNIAWLAGFHFHSMVEMHMVNCSERAWPTISPLNTETSRRVPKESARLINLSPTQQRRF